jgi:hypothetical protein
MGNGEEGKVVLQEEKETGRGGVTRKKFHYEKYNRFVKFGLRREYVLTELLNYR